MNFPGTRLLARFVLAPVAAVALVGAAAACSSGDDAGTGKPVAGACVDVTDNAAGKMTASVLDCGSAQADYRIVKAGDAPQECAADNAGFTGTVAGAAANLCLVPNFAQGSCYADAGKRPAKQVDCTAAEATFKVVKRIDGQADEMLCGADATQFRTIADPKATLCLAKP